MPEADSVGMATAHRRLNRLRLALSRPAAQVGVVLVLSVAVRALLYPHIAIRGDLGYWLADAQFVLAGDRPFVDFVGRSPVFHYAYAAVGAVVGISLASFRWFLTACWLGVGLGAYDLARQARDHYTGLLALALVGLSPFTVAFGFYATSSALGVLFGMAALVVAARRPTAGGYAVAGGLLGLGLMTRQSVVLVGAALWTWLAIQAVRTRDARAGAVRAASAALSGLATTAGVCPPLALGDVQVAWRIFAVDVLALVWSGGAGGVPLLALADEALTGQVAASGGGPLRTLLDRRSVLAIWALIVGGSTLLLGGVAVGRAAGARLLRTRDWRLLATAGAVIAMLAVWRALAAGYLLRALWVVGAALIVAALWRQGRVPTAALAQPAVALPSLAAVWVAVGYAIRPNLFAAYYASDILPFLAPLTAVAVVAWLRQLDWPRRQALVTGGLILVVASTAALSPLSALTTAQASDRVETMQPDTLDTIQQDMNQRVGDDVILASQPIYPAVSEGRVFKGNTRALYLAHAFEGGGPMHDYYRDLIEAMQSGEIGWVVHEEANRQLFAYNATARETFERCYEPVDAGGAYADLNHTLYRHVDC